VLLAGLLVRSFFVFPEVDASQDGRAETFGGQVMSSAPQNALIFTDTDEETFSLWYFHFALHQRPDLRLVAEGLLQYDWYRETLRSMYPYLILTEAFPEPETVAADNPARPTCFVEYTNQTEIECSPP